MCTESNSLLTTRVRLSRQHTIDWDPVAWRRIIVIGVGLLSLGISLWQLTLPNIVSFYDSGVYLAASIHLVSGAMPYRDFVFPQPPGILILMSPAAIFSHFFGSHDGFMLTRVLTALTTAVNASLLSWLVRHRGATAMLISGAGIAVLPVASLVSTSLKLEPYCILLVLIGSTVIFKHELNEHHVTTSSLVVSGLFFGLAGLVKLFAIFPCTALALCLFACYRSRAFIFISAAAGTFIALSLPFFALAPRNFVTQVITWALFRPSNPTVDPSIVNRLIAMTGFSITRISPSPTAVIVIFIALICIVALGYWRRLARESIDLYLLIAAVFTAMGLLIAPKSALYYFYFSSPFLLAVLGISVARLGEPVRTLLRHVDVTTGFHQFLQWIISVLGISVVCSLVVLTAASYNEYGVFAGLNTSSLSVITNSIPAGSCVVYDYVAYGVIANRLQSSNPSCPKVVDSDGMWLGWGYHELPPSPQFVAQWKSYFEMANYVVLHDPATDYVPWDHSLRTWFTKNYHLVAYRYQVFVFENDHPRSASRATHAKLSDSPLRRSPSSEERTPATVPTVRGS